MTGFVSRPPAADADPPEAPPPEVVAGDGWWPDVDLVQLREAVRLDTTIPTARLRDAVRQAMIDLRRQLAAWRAPLEAGTDDAPPYPNLAAVPADEVDGQSVLVRTWTRALYSTVAADLGERLLSQSATAAGADRAEELRAETDQHRRNARWAVSDLRGRPRATVELI